MHKTDIIDYGVTEKDLKKKTLPLASLLGETSRKVTLNIHHSFEVVELLKEPAGKTGRLRNKVKHDRVYFINFINKQKMMECQEEPLCKGSL